MAYRILVADDEKEIRDLLRLYLEKDGYQVAEASDGREALSLLEQGETDMALLDIMMPRMDGYNVLKKLRETSNIPVMILSAKDRDTDKILGLDLGADDYLAKPFQLRELVLRLRRIIRPRVRAAGHMPDGLVFTDDEFFVTDKNGGHPHVLALSGEEKKLMQHLVSPVGNVAPAAPMVAKRLRSKLNGVLSNIDIITIRGRGYKLIHRSPTTDGNNENGK